MSAISTATPDWLALRAAADDTARATELASVLARLLPPGPVVLHDLGAGTGGMTRWLAPRLPGPQQWVLHDGDAEILDHLDLETVADDAGRRVGVSVVVEDLEDLSTGAFAGASAVTGSALLDVVTREEAGRIVAACLEAGVPALFSLSVTGVVILDPPDALDAAIGRAFNDHQRRDADGRRMLGPDAAPLLIRLFTGAGWRVRSASTPWHLGPADAALTAAWLDGWVGAALEQRPEFEPAAEDYLARRRVQLAAGALHVTVSHQDVLAWPR
ncbi:SAM-dependent methyltransferase [Microbacterium capsulatum]|uniref:SAM-dependent methyltransferase n=1 Tax=Microbacterium capsulatum TaxID=3041921 RepID=A0ABU0XDC9_9MICO|nr:SAM-dependent methyltransferase [Microbacterium sp. ASV81]MDQ4212734.1 SAM-dependent methyltransferase [Microbacterium sp. ASV81]